MITFEVACNKTTRIVTFYDEWDVDKSKVVHPLYAKRNDIGKFIRFTDGSNLYGKIIAAMRDVIVTTGCAVIRNDVVYIAIPKVITNIYGVYNIGEVNTLVRTPTNRENVRANLFIGGNMEGHKLTKRERLVVKEKLENELVKLDANAEWMALRLKEEADEPNGRNFAFSMSAIAKQYGLDLTTPPEKENGDSNTSALIGLLGRSLESKKVEDKQYITTLKDLNKIINLAKNSGSTSPEPAIIVEDDLKREEEDFKKLSIANKKRADDRERNKRDELDND